MNFSSVDLQFLPVQKFVLQPLMQNPRRTKCLNSQRTKYDTASTCECWKTASIPLTNHKPLQVPCAAEQAPVQLCHPHGDSRRFNLPKICTFLLKTLTPTSPNCRRQALRKEPSQHQGDFAYCNGSCSFERLKSKRALSLFSNSDSNLSHLKVKPSGHTALQLAGSHASVDRVVCFLLWMQTFH